MPVKVREQLIILLGFYLLGFGKVFNGLWIV